MKPDFINPEMFNRHLSFSIFMAATSVSLAATSLWSKQGKPLMTFAAAMATWLGYLFAHYSTEGKFIDGKEGDGDSKMLPRERKAIQGSILGGSIMVGGMAIGFLGLQQESLLTTSVAATIFLSGYVIAHYAATGELL